MAHTWTAPHLTRADRAALHQLLREPWPAGSLAEAIERAKTANRDLHPQPQHLKRKVKP